MLDYLRAVLVMHTRSERGASVVEYGLLLAGVGLACILGFEVLRLTVRGVFEHQNSVVQEP